MKALITLALILCFYYMAKFLVEKYRTAEQEYGPNKGAPAVVVQPSSTLPGLPPSLETLLQTAQSQGAAGLRVWLNNYRTYVRDPRLASIELDYVTLISLQNPEEAKHVLLAIKQRTSTSSPVYPRIKSLEKNFQ